MDYSFKNIVLSTVVAGLLVGCGGSSSDTKNSSSSGDSSSTESITTNNLSGKVIDGYIKNSTVFLDLNLDGQLTSSLEPSAVTNEKGSYSITLTSAQRNHENFNVAPLIAIGGIDTDTNQAFEGKLEAPNNGSNANLTPLTTVVSKMVQSEDLSNKTESEIKEIINTKKETLKTVLGVSQNTSIDEDFILGENQELNKVALQVQKTVELITKALDNGSKSQDSIQDKVVETLAKKVESLKNDNTATLTKVVDETTKEAEDNTSELSVLAGKVITTQVTNSIKTVSQNIDVAFEEIEKNKTLGESFEDIVEKVIIVVEEQTSKLEKEIEVAIEENREIANVVDTFDENSDILKKSKDDLRLVGILNELEILGVSGDKEAIANELIAIEDPIILFNNFYEVINSEFIKEYPSYFEILNKINERKLSQVFIPKIVVKQGGKVELSLSNTFGNIDGSENFTYEFEELASWVFNDEDEKELVFDSPSNSDVGESSFRVIVKNGNESIGSKKVFLEVLNVNDAPKISNEIADTSINEDDNTLSIDVKPHFTDIDLNDELTFDVTFEDGTLLPSWLGFTDGILTATPTNDNVGQHSLKVTATDKKGVKVSDVFVLTVNNVNDAPTVKTTIPDTAAEQNVEFSLDIKVNFEDVDKADTLTYSAVLDGGSDLPSWLTFEDGVFTGTPGNADITTSALTIVVTAKDSSNIEISDSFTLDVRDKNDAPIVSDTTINTIFKEDLETNINLSDYFSDIDANDVLSYSGKLIQNSNEVELPSWITISGNTLSIIGQNNNVGNNKIKITASDKLGLEVSNIFDIDVENTNDIPVKVGEIPVQNISLDMVSSYLLDVKPYFTDDDIKHGVDALIYDVTFDSGNLLPSWLSFDSPNGILTSTATSDNVGTHQMKVTAIDKAGEKVVQDFILNVEKDKFTQALDKLDSIDPELENIDTKLQEAKNILSTLTSDEASIVTTLISIAEIANNTTINSLVSITNNDDSEYVGTNLNALVKNSVMDFVNIKSLIENASTTKFTTETTSRMHDIAVKLKELSDSLGKYFVSSSDSYTYDNETMTFDDSNALRTTILGIAFKLEYLSSYQWGVDSDFAIQTAADNEYINFDVDAPSILNSGNFFKLMNPSKVLNAKEYLKEAVTIALDIPVGYETEFTNNVKTDIQAIKTAFDGNGQYSFSDFDESDDELSITIDLNKLFASPLELSDLGSNWQYDCNHGKLLKGLTAAEQYGYATCENTYTWYDSYFDTTYTNTMTESPALDMGTSPTTASKIDDIILNITLKENNKILTGQALIDYLFEDNFELKMSDISGKSFTLNPLDGTGYVKFVISSDGTGTETGYFSNDTQEYSENINWNILDGKLKITLDDNSVDYYTFENTPSNGIVVSVDVSDEEPFNATISEFTDIVINNVVTYENLSGKKIAASNGFSYYFVDGKVYRGDADKSNFSSYAWTEEFTYEELNNGTIKIITNWGDYDIISSNIDGTYTINMYYGGEYPSLISSNIVSSTSYTNEELALVLEDTPTRMYAVDPYINGANFCADLDKNNNCDINEPVSTYSTAYDQGSFMFHELIPHGTPILMKEKGKHLGKEFDGNIKAYAGDKTVISPLTTLEVNGFTQTQIINLLENYGIGISNFNSDPFKVFNEDQVDTSLESYDYADLQGTIAIHTFLKMTDYGLTPSMALNSDESLKEPYSTALSLATQLIKSTLNETIVGQYAHLPARYVVYVASAISNYLVEKITKLESQTSGTGISYLQSYLADSSTIANQINLLAAKYVSAVTSDKFAEQKHFELSNDGTSAVEVGGVSQTTFTLDNYLFKQELRDDRYTVEGNSVTFDESNGVATLVAQKVLAGKSRAAVKTVFNSPKQMIKAKVRLLDTSDESQRSELASYMFDKHSLTGIYALISVRKGNIYYYLEKDIYSDEKAVSNTVTLDGQSLDSNLYEGVLVNSSETSYSSFNNIDMALVMSVDPSTGKLTLQVYDTNGILGNPKVIYIPDYQKMNLGFDSSEIRSRVKGSTSLTPEKTTTYFAGFETQNLSALPTQTMSTGQTVLFSDNHMNWLDIAKFNTSSINISLYEKNNDAFIKGEDESLDVSYSNNNLTINLMENNQILESCTNSNTIKVNNFKGKVYSDLYKTQNTCEKKTSDSEEYKWSYEWWNINNLTKSFENMKSLFLEDWKYECSSDSNSSYCGWIGREPLHFEISNKYFMLNKDGEVVLAEQDGYHENTKEPLLYRTNNIVGSWTSTGGQIDVDLSNSYKIKVSFSLDSDGYIVESKQYEIGYTEYDYVWTGSDVMTLFQDVTLINPNLTN